VIEKVLVDGDDAAVHWHSSLELIRTGRVVESERCDLIQFRGGLIQKILCFFDSATMAVMTGRAQSTGTDALDEPGSTGTHRQLPP
ncbi:nuclear transport factor 2 family protein, partial [Acinetobacter baumannii]